MINSRKREAFARIVIPRSAATRDPFPANVVIPGSAATRDPFPTRSCFRGDSASALPYVFSISRTSIVPPCFRCGHDRATSIAASQSFAEMTK